MSWTLSVCSDALNEWSKNYRRKKVSLQQREDNFSQISYNLIMSGPTNPSWESNLSTSYTNVKKTLFQSPSVQENARGSAGTDSSTAMALMNRLQMEQDISAKFSSLQKEMHDQRLCELRILMKTVADDDWKYPNVNKLIGLE